MRKKHAEARPEIECTLNLLKFIFYFVDLEFLGHEMDVRELKFESESFDVAIDKGTMDAMMTAKADVWVWNIFSWP